MMMRLPRVTQDDAQDLVPTFLLTHNPSSVTVALTESKFLSLSLIPPSSTDPKAKKRREKAMEILLEKGYCESCANILFAYHGEVLRKQG